MTNSQMEAHALNGGQVVHPDPFKAAYLSGLTLFAQQVASMDRRDPIAFKQMYRNAINHFGLKPLELGERIDYGKAAMSKWLHTDNMPTLPTRQAVIDWVLEKAQLELMQSE